MILTSRVLQISERFQFVASTREAHMIAFVNNLVAVGLVHITVRVFSLLGSIDAYSRPGPVGNVSNCRDYRDVAHQVIP